MREPSQHDPGGPEAANVTYEWIKSLSTRVSSIEVNAKRTKKVTESGKAKARPAKVHDNYMSDTIPDVRHCNREDFKNRYPDDKGIYAIETLLNSKGLEDDVEAEQLRRATPEQKSRVLKARGSARLPDPKGALGPHRLARVRINSAFILEFLSKVTGEKWGTKPHTFLRPFKILVHFHSRLEEEYHRLCAELGITAEKPSATNDTPHDLDRDLTASPASEQLLQATSMSDPIPSHVHLPSQATVPYTAPELALPDKEKSRYDCDRPTKSITEKRTRKACADMKCYMNFVETQLIPVYRMFNHIDF